MENFKLTEEFLSNACDRFYVDSNDKNTLLKQFAKNKITEENIFNVSITLPLFIIIVYFVSDKYLNYH